MREILFRGKRSDDGKWVEGFLSYGNEIEITFETEDEDGKTMVDRDWISVDSDTVSQCTGLTSKNGKKIFEGDVAEIYYVEGACEIGKIKWSDKKCRFLVILSGDGASFSFDDTLSCKVIGNIYDNPELLEVHT